MKIDTIREKVVLKLSFKELDMEGKEKKTSRSYNKIRSGAEDLSIYKVGKLLGGLQTKEVDKIGKVETTYFEEV